MSQYWAYKSHKCVLFISQLIDVLEVFTVINAAFIMDIKPILSYTRVTKIEQFFEDLLIYDE